MAEPRDERVTAAYRELPGEGPSSSIDAALQAAARRAVGARPAAGRRWQKPLSIAAVFMLAIAVTLQVEREKPVVQDDAPAPAGSAEYPVPQAATQEAAPPAAKPAEPVRAAPAPQPVPDSKRFVPDAPAIVVQPALRAEPPAAAIPAAPPAAAEVAPMQAPAAAPFAAPAPPPRAPAPAAAGAAVSSGAARVQPQAAPRAKSELSREATLQEKRMADMLETPERRLERIADLRAKGLHDEADRELAAFRRDFPAFRLSEEWLRKIDRR